MKRFIEGENREGENRFQSTFFPESPEEYIAKDNLIRVVDAFDENCRSIAIRSDTARTVWSVVWHVKHKKTRSQAARFFVFRVLRV